MCFFFFCANHAHEKNNNFQTAERVLSRRIWISCCETGKLLFFSDQGQVFCVFTPWTSSSTSHEYLQQEQHLAFTHLSFQMRHKLLQNSLNCLTNILKYAHNQLWHSFNYEEVKLSLSISLLGSVDPKSPPLFLGQDLHHWRMESILFWIVLSKLFHIFAFLVKFNVASSGKRFN